MATATTHVRAKGTYRSHRGERGALTLLFCVFAFVIFGFFSLGLLVGGRVTQAMRNQVAADESSRAMAAYAAQGLNMMSVNNLGVGSSLHVHNCLLAFTYSYGIVEAARSTLLGKVMDLRNEVQPGETAIQRKAFDRANTIGSLFLSAANGLTRYNQKLRDFWLYATPAKGLEFGMLNSPGAVVIVSQQAGAERKASAPFEPMTYEEEKRPLLGLTSPKATICAVTSVKPNGSDVDRDKIATFLAGPTATMDAKGGLGKAKAAMDSLASLVGSAMGNSPLKFGFVTCGIALKSSLYAFFKDVGALFAGQGSESESARTAFNASSRVTGTWNLGNDLEDLIEELLRDRRVLPGFTEEIAGGLAAFLANTEKGNVAFILRKMHEDAKPKPPNPEVSYSILNAEACSPTQAGWVHPDCRRTVEVKKRTWMCVYYDDITNLEGVLNVMCVKKGRNILRSAASVGSCTSLFFDRFADYCGSFLEWQKYQDEPTGQVLVDWGCQAKSYIKGKAVCGTAQRALADVTGFGAKTPLGDPSTALGFLVHDLRADKLAAFDGRMNFKSVVATPWLTRDRTKKYFGDVNSSCKGFELKSLEQGGPPACRIETQALLALWLGKTSGFVLTGKEAEEADRAASPDPTLNPTLLTGGLAQEEAKREEEGANPMLLWKRVTISMSKSRTLHLPGPTDPSVKPHMRLMWPAWTALRADVGLAEIVGYGGGIVGTLDALAGHK